MKRAVLTDSRTKAIYLLENPPWRLGWITPMHDGSFTVLMIHQSGDKLTVHVVADPDSLTKRFEGW
ncbi:hypothetical protein JL111_18140 [Paracoccus sp. KCTC 42845]|uniref:Uncharacterized protein n=1 Tax=Paracoccus aerius TaxID=1915382 RepID=A0ABS1S9L4_9RHOB|nr:hypothetical protein [Paracoccus aerius]MBL3675398.1 hypothetical protein [Paracoccus aerius]